MESSFARSAARAGAGLLTAALVVSPAWAQTTPTPRWEVEGFAGLSLFELPSGGTAALPPAGSPLTTSGPTNPSRRVPTWFLGDGAGLLNGVNAEFDIAGRIAPLDGALASLGLSGTNAPAVGLRLRRRLSTRLDVELSADLLPGSRELSAKLVDAVETARASFQSAFTGLLTSGPFTAVAVTATASMANQSSRELATTAAVRWTLTSGAVAPYITLGGGLVHQIGNLPSVTLTGNYRFQILGTVPINETDTLRLRYEQGTAVVGVAGAGVRGPLSERVGWTLGGRVLLSPQTLTLRLDSEPAVATGTPAGFVESFTTPAIQFSNSASTGRESSLSGTPLSGFKAFSTSGLQTRFIITAGLVIRF
jgi:hypothetical protein